MLKQSVDALSGNEQSPYLDIQDDGKVRDEICGIGAVSKFSRSTRRLTLCKYIYDQMCDEGDEHTD